MKILPSKPLDIVIERMIMLSIANFSKENRVKYIAKVKIFVTLEIRRLNSRNIMKYSQKGNRTKYGI